MMSAIDVRNTLGTHDVLFITLDTLRYDVAEATLAQGLTPNFEHILPGGVWERRHSPSSFTYGAHQAFFAGFLPTPITPIAANKQVHERLFAARFAGSETSGAGTLEFDAPDIVTGYAAHGYHTLCVGGTGFFNKQTPLGCVLPNLFAESWWDKSLSVTDPASPKNQVARTIESMASLDPAKRLFSFINFSACHQPNHFYLPGALSDSPASQGAALAAIDAVLEPLLAAAQRRAPVLFIACSDHGEAYGEDGYEGHRIGHSVVWDVPYAHAVLPQKIENL